MDPDDDRIDSFAHQSVPRKRSERKKELLQSPFSQDDQSPSPMQPSSRKRSPIGNHLSLPLNSQRKDNIHQNVVQEETDTDFKDSALGETAEITEAAVREFELQNQ